MPEQPEKRALRQRFMALRDGLAPEDRDRWSRRICSLVGALCEARGFTSLAAFWPLGSEVDLRPLAAAHPHWTFHFPRITARTPPTLAWGTPPLGPGAWGLSEPLEAPWPLPPVQLLLAPGLAFAEDGHRLGYGRGFYDATLARLSPDVATLGTGFACQRCAALPVGPTDLPLQGFVDQDGITWFTPA